MEKSEEPIEILRQGADTWNRWRDKNPSHDKIFLHKANLRGISLQGVNLKEVKLSSADLGNANFENTNLEGADLSRANLSGTSFRNSNLKGANLSNTDLNGTNFSGANLSNVNFSGASLSNVNLSGASLKNTQFLEYRTGPGGSGGYEAKASLSNVDLSGANLSNANLCKITLSKVDLTNANLNNASLREANLSEVNLRGADLSGISASRANFSFACFQSANLSNAIFDGADLNGADFSGAKLSNTHLGVAHYNLKNYSGKEVIQVRHTDLSFACFKDSTLSAVNLSGADLNGVDFSGARLGNVSLLVYAYNEEVEDGKEKARFIRSNLNATRFNSTVLSNVDMRGASLYGADFSMARLTSTSLDSVMYQDETLFVTQLNDSCFDDAIFSNVSLNGANLTNASFRKAILPGANFEKASLLHTCVSEANLNSACFKEADLSFSDLTNANFRGCDLRDAQLIAAQAMGTDFTKARFTGACLEGWSINGRTNLDSISCDYIYLERKHSHEEERLPVSGRHPNDATIDFRPGEFKALFQKDLQTAELSFSNGIDWQAFFLTFQRLCETYQNENLSVQAIEKKSSTSFSILLEVSPEVSSSAVESRASELYVSYIQALEVERRLQRKSAVTKMSYEEMHQIAEIIQKTSEFREGSQKGGPRLIEQSGLNDTFANFSFSGQPRSDSRSMVYHLQERRKLGPLIRLLMSYTDTSKDDTEYLTDVLDKYAFDGE